MNEHIVVRYSWEIMHKPPRGGYLKVQFEVRFRTFDLPNMHIFMKQTKLDLQILSQSHLLYIPYKSPIIMKM